MAGLARHRSCHVLTRNENATLFGNVFPLMFEMTVRGRGRTPGNQLVARPETFGPPMEPSRKRPHGDHMSQLQSGVGRLRLSGIELVVRLQALVALSRFCGLQLECWCSTVASIWTL
jgi:hypothetical protein